MIKQSSIIPTTYPDNLRYKIKYRASMFKPSNFSSLKEMEEYIDSDDFTKDLLVASDDIKSYPEYRYFMEVITFVYVNEHTWEEASEKFNHTINTIKNHGNMGIFLLYLKIFAHSDLFNIRKPFSEMTDDEFHEFLHEDLINRNLTDRARHVLSHAHCISVHSFMTLYRFQWFPWRARKGKLFIPPDKMNQSLLSRSNVRGLGFKTYEEIWEKLRLEELNEKFGDWKDE